MFQGIVRSLALLVIFFCLSGILLWPRPSNTSTPSPVKPTSPALPVCAKPAPSLWTSSDNYRFLPTSYSPSLKSDPFTPYLHSKFDTTFNQTRMFVDQDLFRSNGDLNLTLARQLVKDMFFHSWTGYLNFAYPSDELAPISCGSKDTHGGIYITLIDSADTLAVMGEWNEFGRAVSLIESIPNFDINTNVSLFETNIRILGGLLSTHIIAKRHLPEYTGSLIGLATDLAERLLNAFTSSDSGIPYGTVNLRYGVPNEETPIVCTACALSLSLEFGYLSHLTGNSTYMDYAKRAARKIWDERSSINLLGNHIDSASKEWTAVASGIAGQLDSAYEYFLKTFIVFHDPFWYKLFIDAYTAVETHALQDGWHVLVDMNSAFVYASTVSSLQAFWSGLQVLAGDLLRATRLLERVSQLAWSVPFLPELVDVKSGTSTMNSDWPQRPELIESMLAVYQATKDPGLLDAAFEYTRRIVDYTRTPCGFAGVRNVGTLELQDAQESFFLSETLKYLYLMFDPTNQFHDEEWVFTTEAHPLPILVNHERAKFNKYKLDHLANNLNYSTTFLKDPIQRTLTRKRTWVDEQCDAYEHRVVQSLYSLAPWNRTRSWFRNWGY